MAAHDRRTAAAAPSAVERLGGLGIVLAVVAFAVTVWLSLRTEGTTFVWSVNMLSDLGDGECRERGGRWICSPGHALFNVGVVVTGALLAGSAWLVRRPWGRLLSTSLAVMGAGLIVAAVFDAGRYPVPHLAGVVLALVVPSAGLMVSGFRPMTRWLVPSRVPRAVLGLLALILCAENRLPNDVISPGNGQAAIVALLLAGLLWEAIRLLATRPVTASR